LSRPRSEARQEARSAYAVERTKIARAFGRQLQMLRRADEHSQDSLAQVARLHRSEISLLERGQRAPGLLTIMILTEAFWVSPDVLLEGVPVPQERRSMGAKTGRRRSLMTSEITNEKQQLHLLGQAIQSVREAKGLSIEALAAAAEVTSKQLEALEAGRLDPDYELLLGLAECLDTRPSAFVIKAEELGCQE
jgi:transcriptional regulator with XRE-family HTH domain